MAEFLRLKQICLVAPGIEPPLATGVEMLAALALTSGAQWKSASAHRSPS